MVFQVQCEPCLNACSFEQIQSIKVGIIRYAGVKTEQSTTHIDEKKILVNIFLHILQVNSEQSMYTALVMRSERGTNEIAVSLSEKGFRIYLINSGAMTP